MVYHVFNKSIADFVIFNNDFEFQRMLEAIKYYQTEKPIFGFADFLELKRVKEKRVITSIKNRVSKENLVEIVAYCIMPTHIHLILKELKEQGIPMFMSNILNSHARYFNIKYGRKGHLWEGRYKKKLVDSGEQLLHLTRYIHLNPVTAYIVDKPEDWRFSSYNEYLSKGGTTDGICRYTDLLNIESNSYNEFVKDNISYQRELALIKDLFLE